MTCLSSCPLVEMTFGNSKVKVGKEHQRQPQSANGGWEGRRIDGREEVPGGTKERKVESSVSLLGSLPVPT